MDKIQIFDTTLRDGEQVPGCKLNKNQKIFCKQLNNLGVDIIEADFQFPRQAILNLLMNFKANSRTNGCGLSRAVKDIDIAAEALKPAKRKEFILALALPIPT